MKKGDETTQVDKNDGPDDRFDVNLQEIYQNSVFPRVFSATLRERSPSRVFFVVGYVVLATGLPLLYVHQPLHFDEAIFHTIGKQMMLGETLYVDIADNKLPGIFLTAAVIHELFGNAVLAARVLTYVVTAISGLLVIRLGKVFCNRQAAYGGGVLFVIMSYLPHFDGFYYLTEQFAVLTILVSAVLLGYETTISKVAVGVVLGVGVLFNQTVFLFGATIILFYLIKLRYEKNRCRAYLVDSTKQILSIGVGFLTLIAIALTVLASQGVLEEMIYYSIVLPVTSYTTPFDLWGHVLAFGMLLPVWLLTSGMIVVTAVAIARGDTVDERFLFVTLWAVVLSYPGATSFAGDHKFLFAFPAIALLTVKALSKAFEMVAENDNRLSDISERLRIPSALLSWLLVAVLLSTAVVSGAGNVYYASNLNDGGITEEKQGLTDAIEGVDGPVYGYNVMASLYVHTETSPGTAYLGTIYTDGLAEGKIADLESNNVQYVIVKTTYVTDDRVTSGVYWADHKSTMTAYINQNYEPVRKTDDYVIFERTS